MLLLSKQIDVIHAHGQEETLLTMHRTSIPSLVLSPIHFPIELFGIVFPTVIRHVGDHTDFVQQEQPVLQCSTKMLATCVVEDVSKNLDILTLESFKMLERLSFLLGCKLILRRLFVLHILVVLQYHPLLLRPSFVMLTNLAP